VTILGRYRGRAPAGAALELAGTTLGDPLRVHVACDSESATADWLSASWARARIRDLEDRYAAGEQELEREIVTASKRHGVLSRFTAFIAIDRSQVANAGGRIRQVVQPVEPPAGWEFGSAIFAMHRVSQPLASTGSLEMAQLTMGSVPESPAPIRRVSLSREKAAPAGPMDRAYLESLATLARELEAEGRGPADAARIRMLRERLTEWIENVRSVGGSESIVAAVEDLVNRLSATLDAGTSLGKEAVAVATELAALAAGGAPARRRRNRILFWK
jgi:Ca-activated chloride channel family protein